MNENANDLKQDQTSALTSVTKQRTKITRLMANEENLSEVKDELELFNKKFERYVDIHMQYMEQITSEEDLDREERRYEERERSALEFRSDILSWISWVEERLLTQHDSVSQIGQSSCTSHSSSSKYPRSKVSSSASPYQISKSSWPRFHPPKFKSHRDRQRTDLKPPSRSEHTSSHHLKSSKSSQVSNSDKSSKSSCVSSSPTLTKVKAQIAGLLVEREMLTEKQRLKAAEEQLALQTEIKKAKARERAIEEAENGVPFVLNPPYRVPLLTPASFQHEPKLDPTAAEFIPIPKFYDQRDEVITPFKKRETKQDYIDQEYQDLKKQRQHEEMINSYQQLTAAITLPQPKVPVFNGDPGEYASFIMAFSSRIESRTSNDADRLYYMDQHLEGEPKDLIGGCLYLEPTEGYSEARRLLHEEYGDPYKVAMAYVNQALNWPALKQDDGAGLRKLSLFLLKCKNIMKNVEYLNILNHAPNMQALVQKLPYFLQNKWREHATSQKRHLKIVSFEDLVGFVTSAAESANHPIYGREAMKTDTKYKDTERWKKRIPQIKSTSFATRLQQSGSSGSTESSGRPGSTGSFGRPGSTESSGRPGSTGSFGRPGSTGKGSFGRPGSTGGFGRPGSSGSSGRPGSTAMLSCAYCKEMHDMDDCDKFKGLTIEEKKNYLKTNVMCYACYGPNHVSKGCTKKRTCTICNKYGHPTSMHIEGFDVERFKGKDAASAPPVINNASIDVMDNSPVILHTILPVKVKSKDSKQDITTYAFYDGGSAGCFVTEDLQSQLGATGIETSIQLGTMHGEEVVKTTALNNLIVSDLNGDNVIQLPRAFTRPCLPVNHLQIPRPEVIQCWQHLKDISEQMPEYQPELKIGLLIGSNCPAAFEPLEVRPSEQEGPYAVRLRHGWTISTPLQINFEQTSRNITANRITTCPRESIKEVIAPETLIKMFQLDFNEDSNQDPNSKGHSQEDKRFLKTVDQETHLLNGHYVVPMPFRQPNIRMPNNRNQVLKQAFWLKNQMLKDERYRTNYTKFMNDMMVKNYARKVPEETLRTTADKVWYLPHHGVYHPHKPDKIRVVFNCSAKCDGVSLNDRLLQGPNLTNSLVGVLLRFRKEHVAFMADVEAMFHQALVPLNQVDFLRFFWWPDGDLSAETPKEHQMLVHLFGATSSPSCANYALRKCAQESEQIFGSLAAGTILRNFYVDDCLKSVHNEEIAVQLISDLRKMCASGGFHLTKFISNRINVIQTLPVQECSSKLGTLDLAIGEYNLPIERVLGVQWSVKSDVLGFHITANNKPPTRRGILSTVSSIYDPLGFIAPFTLPAKKILQELCTNPKIGWDDEVPDEQRAQWEKWVTQLPLLEHVIVNRCYKPNDFGETTSQQVHIFSDASSMGYGSSAYLRLVNDKDQVHCAFLFGKSRLAPIKATTIPRLELTAATVSARIGQMLKKELDTDPAAMMYHTDSTTVLRYIFNEQQRFKVFVANRVQLIRECSNPLQWRYVPSLDNPADDASRGVDAKTLTDEQQRWLKGPEFLWKGEEEWPSQPFTISDEIPNDDQELKCISSATSVSEPAVNATNKLISYFSDWFKSKKAVAVFLRLKKILKQRYHQRHDSKRQDAELTALHTFTNEDIEEAEEAIIKFTQAQHFSDEINLLEKEADEEVTRGRASRRTPAVPKSSSIRRLDPYVDSRGILRVGGRLRRANIPKETKYPMILPRKSNVTESIIRQAHKELGHAGRAHVMAKLRQKYWIISINAATRQVIYKCVVCRRLHSPPNEQKMSDLPKARLEPAPPFTYVGLDFFGPFSIKEKRKTLKIYGALFTCLTSRAIHIELTATMDTDSCIQAIRRFISRRGQVKEIYCDNGTNLVGAERELRTALQEIDDEGMKEKLLQHQINWKFNPPTASHMGGSWERQIRSVRKILSGLLYEHGDRLNAESIQTLMCEVEAIINSRPLTVLSSEPDDLEPLSPSQLLTMKSNNVGYPPGNFQQHDIYLRRRWRRIQYLANLFWSRWRKEYVVTLQERHKWNVNKRNLEVGDVVLLKEANAPRNAWPIGIVIACEKDTEGNVRAVEVKTQSSKLRRPIAKLILLVPHEDKEE